jgi:6-phosphogluconate dehydrogenase
MEEEEECSSESSVSDAWAPTSSAAGEGASASRNLMAANEEGVPAEVISAALYTRFRSRREHTFAEKLFSAMRRGFGGHVEPQQEG